ncbi:dienelactone hydrolase family protein [Telluribacter humicola]|uniref:dienelactone hydrolase family protein n=1 Tax=Telluribacter humicola TaxID=1720261 RepID=UPI001A976F4F|nr:dienelactone hydrolase family protein [Telluribacter humicola]
MNYPLLCLSLLVSVVAPNGLANAKNASTSFSFQTSMNLPVPDPDKPADKKKQRKELYQLLGRLPDRNRPISVKVVSREETDEMIVEKLLMDINGQQEVPAYFTKPKNSTGKVPVILFNHSHFGQYEVGKNEFIKGRKEMQSPPYALALARAGYAGLCLDSWGFGERKGPSELDIFKEMLWKGQVMWGMMVYDNLRALDYLETRSDVDMKRVGTMGMSMGSTMAWWLAALDERIKVCVDMNCLTDYQTLIEEKGLNRHGIYYYVPDLLNHFSTSSINALIAPRPHLGVAGSQDPLTPLKGLAIIDENLKEVYRKEGAPDAWQLRIYDVPHLENAEMRQDIMAFFKKWL